MDSSIQSINSNKAGLCPHGTIPGACPICSGMGGGGRRVGERPQKAGEWSYHHCAMVGNLMKAREARINAHEQNVLKHAENIRAFEQHLAELSQKLAEFVSRISSNVIMKPVAVIIKNIGIPIINTIKNIAGVIAAIADKINVIKEKLIDIQDKLNAIFGEAKAFADKKISEFVSVIKSKVKNLFKIFQPDNTKDDETKIDEDKKIFRLKSFIQKLLNRDKKRGLCDRKNQSGS